MRAGLLCFVALVTLVAVTYSHPLDTSFPDPDQAPADTPASVVRDKRTVGVLRQLFPNFSQFVDRTVAMITQLVFRVVGRLVLQGGGGLGGGGTGGGNSDGGGEGRISITLPTYPPLPDDEEDEDATEDAATTTAAPADEAENAVAESKMIAVRAKRAAEDEAEAEEDDAEEKDLDANATGDNNEVNDDEEEVEESDADSEDPRNKRFLNFNLGASAGATGSGGGSGNFIFDIIRLIAGSGTTPEGDEAANSADGAAKEENYGVGVPGPLTRLFVIANRGVASLIQDLILRMAQTSERLVNFKARLITSII